jgi:hypothetical protein
MGRFLRFSVMPRLDRRIQSGPPVKPGGDNKNVAWIKALWGLV